MSALEKIYNFLSFEIEEPKMYGIFHLVSIAVIIILTTIVCKMFNKSPETTERRIALWSWIILVVFEAYKQFIYIFNADEGFIIDYTWHGFPFQLCSSPLYVLPFIAFLPSGKIREAFVSYFGTFVLLGGIVVLAYPGTVFVETLGIDIHTMIWHGSQIILGIYFNLRRFSSENPPKLKKYFLSSLPIFLSFVAVAMILNEVFYGIFTAIGLDKEVNLFYISPHFETVFPVFDKIQANSPYPVFLLSYLATASVFSFILIIAEEKIITVCKKKHS